MKTISFSLKLLISTLILLSILLPKAFAAEKNTATYITNVNNINLTETTTKNFETIKKLIEIKKPKTVFIEQWVLLEPQNNNLLKKIHGLTKKNDARLYLIVGKNDWVNKFGITQVLSQIKAYGKHIDGIVLRIEPNKTNIWQEYGQFNQAKLLSQMLDTYNAIHKETKKLKLDFIAEFPFWLADFRGPVKSFPQDACDYTDKIVFLIDEEEKLDLLDDLNIKWNDVTCRYYINLTKRANNKTNEKINEILNRFKTKLSLYSNFYGYIVDSDSIEGITN